MINFITGGAIGDVIHQLYIVKNLCEINNDKANLFLVDSSYQIEHCIDYHTSLEKTYKDLYNLIIHQKYINCFRILPKTDVGHFLKKTDFINLAKWRVAKYENWSNLLSKEYNFKIPEEYPWIFLNKKIENLSNTNVIHRSTRRHNNEFDWNKCIESFSGDTIFISSNEQEYVDFCRVNSTIPFYKYEDIYDLALILNSCKLFIGNQSSPFALANGLDILRVCELYYNSYEFYIGEEKYSENISWFFQDSSKYNSSKVYINI